MKRFHDDETIAAISCPTLVLDPDGEEFWPGQSQAMCDELTCEKQLVRSTTGEGADWHCEPAAQSLARRARLRLPRRRVGLTGHTRMSPFAIVVIVIVGLSGMLLWVGALVDAAQYDAAIFRAVGRAKRATLTIVAVTWAFGGAWYWLRLKRPLRAADGGAGRTSGI
jgi:hypothetical protein